MSLASTGTCSARAAAIAEYAGAGADIEDAAHAGDARTLAQRLESQQAAAGGAVMAGAEGERGLDLDTDLVGSYAGSIMGAVDDKAPGS